MHKEYSTAKERRKVREERQAARSAGAGRGTLAGSRPASVGELEKKVQRQAEEIRRLQAGKPKGGGRGGAAAGGE